MILFLFSLAYAGDLGKPLPFPEQPDIYLDVVAGQANHLFLFAPHENENVVNAYAAQKVKEHGGWFAVLRQKGTRHIILKFEADRFELDPNRMFTKRGAQNSIKKLNPGISDEDLDKAVARAVRLGAFVLAQMGGVRDNQLIVAIHNNTNGYDNDGSGGIGTVSMKRYQKRLEGGARYILELNHSDGDEDDFFFITHRGDFALMKQAGFNIVLQHPQVAHIPEEDDGSLSVLAEIKGGRYINVEAQRKHDDGTGRDHLEEQKKMLDLVFSLPAKYK